MLLCLVTSLAFAYSCNATTTGTTGDGGNGGDDGNGGDGGGNTTDCTTTPFHNDCLTDTDALALRVTHCITAGNASETRCNALFTGGASASANTCPVNPFSDTCSIANGAFTTYADTARTNRVTFCNANSGNNLCGPITTCEATPFASSCGAYFAETRATRITKCSIRANVDSTCTGALANPNVATWLKSFTTALGTTPASTNPPRYGFLQGGATTVDFGSLRLSNGSNPVVRTLNLRDATYNNVALGGNVEDGIAYFEARIGSNDGGYAGIFSGTNLGAPLPAYVAESEPIVVWNGKFGVRGSNSIVNRDFTLNVNLQTRKIDAFVQQNDTTHYKLDGDFNDKGVIVNGTVVLGNFTGNDKDMVILPDANHKLGILTGLIGQEGAVGVFIADDAAAGTRNYSGGFVAKAP